MAINVQDYFVDTRYFCCQKRGRATVLATVTVRGLLMKIFFLDTFCKHSTKFVISLVVLISVLCSSFSSATEGGESHYLPGVYGDFGMGYIPDEGFYFTSLTLYTHSEQRDIFLGGHVVAKVKADTTMTAFKLSYLAKNPTIGGMLGFGIVVPVIYSETVDASLHASWSIPAVRSRGQRNIVLEGSEHGQSGGLSDIMLLPIIANWNIGDFYFTVTPILYLPTGHYDPKLLSNPGLNYITIEPNISATWLNKDWGQEISVNAGYMFNFNNTRTGYHSGNEFHFEWLAAQHFTKWIGLGVTGYLYQQATPDTGTMQSCLAKLIRILLVLVLQFYCRLKF